jgi:hypothetical protein
MKETCIWFLASRKDQGGYEGRCERLMVVKMHGNMQRHEGSIYMIQVGQKRVIGDDPPCAGIARTSILNRTNSPAQSYRMTAV